ncbi:succinate dehydrogenase flavoprotein subunit [Bombiscardovia apis]|uniref:succinate dehydrogenase n=1 Tax=Bombiscardovia apis TaxID=2932182 RepID=A0ABN6SEG0_9BIFI|nr:FAD-binding protein [Bombiscardovia apis]BDR54420.1 succinate dehydrogenase flavoprotein subunit [Bombiscardovia apis]
MSPAQIEQEYDAVIVGAGAAGLSAVLGLLERSGPNHKPKLLVISKLQALRSHTGSAEGGIAASLGNEEHDDWHWHYFDTVKGGDWLVDQDAAKILAQEARQTVIGLEHSGVAFSRRDNGHISQRKFGGHTSEYGAQPVKRAAYAADRIGHQILTSLWQQCLAQGVSFAEEWYVSDLVLSPARDRVEGLVAIDMHSGNVHAVRSKQIILCTGGAGRLFHTTSNSWDLTGDGMSAALCTGLELKDLEFIQFHPTGLGHTGFLLSEAARGEGGILRNSKGHAFMADYAPEHRDLAARDVVSRAIMSQVDQGLGIVDPAEPEGRADCVWLDLTSISPKTMAAKLPQVDETIRMYAGLDPAVDLIPVKPTAHYMMGGIPTTTDGQVYRLNDGERQVVEGLYAAGECACVGVHGANRLGGNSLLDACLFGRRAGQSAAEYLHNYTESKSELQELELAQACSNRREYIQELLSSASKPPTASESPASRALNAYQLLERLGQLMDETLSVRCNAEGMESALSELEHEIIPTAQALQVSDPSPRLNQELSALLEVQGLVQVAQAVLKASLARQESRGSLYRSDYPKRDDEHFLQHSLTNRNGQVDWQPVHIVDFPPKTRGY